MKKSLCNIIVLLVVSNVLLFCCKSTQVVTTTVIKDSVVVTTVLDTVGISVVNDSSRFNSLIDSLLLLEGELLTQKLSYEDSLNKEIQKKQTIKYLTKGIYKDTTFNIPIYIEFKSTDSIFVQAGRIEVSFNDGKISHSSHLDKVSVPTRTEIKTITKNRKFTNILWVTDKRTIFLIALLLILIFLFGILLKRN